MAAGDAKPIAIKNTPFRCYFEIRKNDGTVISAAASIAATISKDGGTFAALTGSPTVAEIATSSGVYYIDIAQGDMNCDCAILKVTSSSPGAVTVVIPLYTATPTEIPVDVQSIAGTSAAATYQADLLAAGIVTGTVDTATFAATTTAFESNLDNVSANQAASYFVGRTVLFTTSGAGNLQGQVGRVTASAYTNSKCKLTVTTLTAAPANSARFYLL